MVVLSADIFNKYIVIFVSLQSILVPSLDYFALNAKVNGSTFYNYATVASLAATVLSQYVIDSKELIGISPLINGFMTTYFYIVSFLGPLFI